VLLVQAHDMVQNMFMQKHMQSPFSVQKQNTQSILQTKNTISSLERQGVLTDFPAKNVRNSHTAEKHVTRGRETQNT